MARHTITFKEGNCKLRFDDYIKITFNNDSSGGDTAAINNHDYPIYVAYKNSILRFLDVGEITAGQTVVGQFKGNKIIIYATDFPSSSDGPVDPSVKQSMWLYRNTLMDYPSIYQYIYLKPYMKLDANIVNPNSTYTISFTADSLNNIDDSAKKKIAAIVFDDVRSNNIRRVVPIVDVNRNYLTISDIIESMTFANGTNNISVEYTEYVKCDNFTVAAFVAANARAKDPTNSTKLTFNYAKNLAGKESLTYGTAITADVTETIAHDYMGHGNPNATENDTVYTLSGFCNRKMPTSIHILTNSSTDKNNAYSDVAHTNGSKIEVLGLYKSKNGIIINPKDDSVTDINIARVAKTYKVAKFDNVNLVSDEDSTIGVHENYWLLPDLNSLINIYNHLVNETELIEPTEDRLHDTSTYKYISSNRYDINSMDGITIYCNDTPDESVINIIRDISSTTTSHLKINLVDGGRSRTNSAYATELFKNIKILKSNPATDHITVLPYDSTWPEHMQEKKLLVKGNTLDILRTKLSGNVNYDKVLNESNTTPIEVILIGLDDFTNFEAKYKELKKVYTVDAKHKIEFFDSRYNFINDDTTPNTKTSDDVIPTADKTYNVVLNPNTYTKGIGCLPKFSELKDGDIITLTLNDQYNFATKDRRTMERPVTVANNSFNPSSETFSQFFYPVVDVNFNYVSYDTLLGKSVKLKFKQVMKSDTVDFGYLMVLGDLSNVYSHRNGFYRYNTLNWVTTDNYIMAKSSNTIILSRDETSYSDAWPHVNIRYTDTNLKTSQDNNLYGLIPNNVFRVITPVNNPLANGGKLSDTLSLPQFPSSSPLCVLKRDTKITTSGNIKYYIGNVVDYTDFAKYTVEPYVVFAHSGASDTFEVYPAVRNLINYYTRKKQGTSYDSETPSIVTVSVL